MAGPSYEVFEERDLEEIASLLGAKTTAFQEARRRKESNSRVRGSERRSLRAWASI
jgi:hypothetical protein